MSTAITERIQRLGLHVAVHAPARVGEAGPQRALAPAQGLGRLLLVVVDDQDGGELVGHALAAAGVRRYGCGTRVSLR